MPHPHLVRKEGEGGKKGRREGGKKEGEERKKERERK